MLQHTIGNTGDVDVKPTAFFIVVRQCLICGPAQEVNFCVVGYGAELMENKVFTCVCAYGLKVIVKRRSAH